MRRNLWLASLLMLAAIGLTCHSVGDVPEFGTLPVDTENGDPSDYRFQAISQQTLAAHQFINSVFRQGIDLSHELLKLDKWKDASSPQNVAADTLFFLNNGQLWVRKEVDTGSTVLVTVDTVQFLESDMAVQFPDDNGWTGMRWRMYHSQRDIASGESLSIYLDLTWTGDLAHDGFITGNGSAVVRGLSTPPGASNCLLDCNLSAALTDIQVRFAENARIGRCPEGGSAGYNGSLMVACDDASADFNGAWSVVVSFQRTGMIVAANNASIVWNDTLTCTGDTDDNNTDTDTDAGGGTDTTGGSDGPVTDTVDTGGGTIVPDTTGDSGNDGGGGGHDGGGGDDDDDDNDGGNGNGRGRGRGNND